MNQKGLMPVILIATLLVLGTITAVGTYFALNYSQPVKESVNPVQNPLPAPSITEQITIEEVKAANEESLLNMKGVEKVEVGQKDGKPCVVVFTFQETDELENLENTGLNGYKVVVENSSQAN